MKSRLIFVSLLLTVLFAFAPAVLAQNVSDAVNGLDQTAGSVDAFKESIGQPYDNAFLSGEVGKIIGLVLSFIGVLFLGLMIYAGISWMTANGNEQTVSAAKALIVNASIGIIIVFGAYAITSFIGNQILK